MLEVVKFYPALGDHDHREAPTTDNIVSWFGWRYVRFARERRRQAPDDVIETKIIVNIVTPQCSKTLGLAFHGSVTICTTHCAELQNNTLRLKNNQIETLRP